MVQLDGLWDARKHNCAMGYTAQFLIATGADGSITISEQYDQNKKKNSSCEQWISFPRGLLLDALLILTSTPVSLFVDDAPEWKGRAHTAAVACLTASAKLWPY